MLATSLGLCMVPPCAAQHRPAPPFTQSLTRARRARRVALPRLLALALPPPRREGWPTGLFFPGGLLGAGLLGAGPGASHADRLPIPHRLSADVLHPLLVDDLLARRADAQLPGLGRGHGLPHPRLLVLAPPAGLMVHASILDLRLTDGEAAALLRGRRPLLRPAGAALAGRRPPPCARARPGRAPPGGPLPGGGLALLHHSLLSKWDVVQVGLPLARALRLRRDAGLCAVERQRCIAAILGGPGLVDPGLGAVPFRLVGLRLFRLLHRFFTVGDLGCVIGFPRSLIPACLGVRPPFFSLHFLQA